ncbi:hypothetical protein [Corynebacterium amycolatum]
MPTQDAKLRDIQRRLERDVAAKIDEFGVPMDTDAVYDIAVELHPIVVKYRQEAYRAYVEQMGRDMAQLGLEVAPARIQGYGPTPPTTHWLEQQDSARNHQTSSSSSLTMRPRNSSRNPYRPLHSPITHESLSK